MNKFILSLLVGFFFLNLNSYAQKVYCGYDLAVESMEKKHPGYKDVIDRTFKEAQKIGKESRLNHSSMTYTIPVVVHVVWNQAEENIPDSLITSQIEVLNEDYRRLNADAGNIRPIFENIVGDPMVEFDLVAIERVQTTELFQVDLLGALPDNVKVTAQGGSDAYDTETHLNIWICMIQPIGFGGISLGQVLGYAYPPDGLANWPEGVSAPSPELDGVVIDYRVIGRNSPFEVDPGLGMPIETRGRTATHEVGHYLGLRHIWGDGGGLLGGDSCAEDDGVADTPNAGSQSNFDCNTNQNTCNDGLGDQPDMIENFMDYAAETCMNSFTQGQIDIMRGVLESERCELVQACDASAVNAIDVSSLFKVSPNPTTGQLFFETSLIDIEDYTAQLVNMAGQVMPVNMNLADRTFNLEGLENGLYILKLQNGNKQVLKKISVLK